MFDGLLRSARSGFYATRSVNKNNGRQASSLILVARQFASEGAPQDERKQSGPMLQTAASPSNLPHRSNHGVSRVVPYRAPAVPIALHIVWDGRWYAVINNAADGP